MIIIEHNGEETDIPGYWPERRPGACALQHPGPKRPLSNKLPTYMVLYWQEMWNEKLLPLASSVETLRGLLAQDLQFYQSMATI